MALKTKVNISQVKWQRKGPLKFQARVPNRIIQLITKAHSAPSWLNYQMQEVGEFVNAGSGIYPHIERLLSL